MGFDEDLTKALANAKAETAKFLVEQRKVSSEQAAWRWSRRPRIVA